MGGPRRKRGNGAVSYGVPSGVLIALFGIGDLLTQARWRAAIPLSHGLAGIAYLFLAATLLLVALAGRLAARASGRVAAGAGAGAIAAAVASAFLLPIILFVESTHGTVIRASLIPAYFILGALYTLGGAMGGAVAALPGTLIRWVRQRAQRRQGSGSIAQQPGAAYLSMPPSLTVGDSGSATPNRAQSRRRRSRRGDVKDNLTVWAMLLASLALATVPIFATESAYHSLAPIHALWLGVATLCAGTSVFWIFRRAGRSQYVADWLALAALTIGSQLIFIEISGYVILLLSLLAAAVYFWRAVKRWIRVASPLAPEPLERPPVRFRYDAQEIVVYPRRRTLAKHAPFMGLLAIFAFGAAVLLRDTTFVIVLSFGALGVLGVVAMTADLVRLVHRWPALVVDVNGITDRASAVVLGFGLIPWHEIADIADSSQVLRRGNLPELVIFPRSYDRLLACQPPLKRPFLRLGSMMSGKTIRVSALLLPMPPRELRLQMLDYVKTHAPPGYLDAEVSVKATKPPLRET